MKNQKSFWIFVVDQSRGRLLEGSIAPPDRPHLDEVDAVSNTEEPHEHERSSPRRQDGHAYADTGHETEELSRRYAKSVVDWLAGRVHERGIEHVTVFAPPRLAGDLRGQWTPQLQRCIEEKQVDLGRLAAGELARHKALSDLFSRLS